MNTKTTTENTKYIYTLLPQYDLKLFAYKAHDPERFCRNFRTAWKRIPQAVRQTLLVHWQKQRQYFPFYPDCELIRQALSPGLFKITHNGTRAAGMFIVDDGIKFNADRIECFNDTETQEICAHELAHAYQYALIQRPFWADDIVEIERGCLAYLIDWGFWPQRPTSWPAPGRG